MRPKTGTVLGKTWQYDWSGGCGAERPYIEVVDDEGRRYLFPYWDFSFLAEGDRVAIEFVPVAHGSTYRPRKIEDERTECVECDEKIPEGKERFNRLEEVICIPCDEKKISQAEMLFEDGLERRNGKLTPTAQRTVRMMMRKEGR